MNTRWVRFYTEAIDTSRMDYSMQLAVTDMYVSPETVSERCHEESKEIEAGTEKEKD